MKDDDTAALIAQMREHIAAWDRDMMSIYDNKRIPFVQTAAELCDALSRAQADAARMREALEGLLHIEPRDLGHVDTIRAYQAARAALENNQ